jgi:hypothetical protein
MPRDSNVAAAQSRKLRLPSCSEDNSGRTPIGTNSEPRSDNREKLIARRRSARALVASHIESTSRGHIIGQGPCIFINHILVTRSNTHNADRHSIQYFYDNDQCRVYISPGQLGEKAANSAIAIGILAVVFASPLIGAED